MGIIGGIDDHAVTVNEHDVEIPVRLTDGYHDRVQLPFGAEVRGVPVTGPVFDYYRQIFPDAPALLGGPEVSPPFVEKYFDLVLLQIRDAVQLGDANGLQDVPGPGRGEGAEQHERDDGEGGEEDYQFGLYRHGCLKYKKRVVLFLRYYQVFEKLESIYREGAKDAKESMNSDFDSL
jgi:hypothetical protein